MSKKDQDYNIYLFNEGTNNESYKFFKASYVAKDGRKQWRFRCWAPNARSVSVVGDFNNWDRQLNPMRKINGGVWEGYVIGVKKYDNYKFSVEQAHGEIVNKADPFALHTETPPATASKIYDISGYEWHDAEYRAATKNKNTYASPINIYEVHIGSWKRHDDGNYYSYRDLAKSLVEYVKDMGYTHVEFLPVSEHPLEMSWGYQPTGLFAPTSRFGTPHDFMYLIDSLHQAGIGVILDMVLSHFPKDAFGLYKFDGTPQYEYDDPLKAEHKGWGTMVFDYNKGAVKSFLISCACFWLEYYHIDGIRMDAVASMLYLDYDRKDGEWRPNVHGGNHNLEAIEFLKAFNKTVLTKYPYAITIAEESTAFPMVTFPSDLGGLGFNYKWDMGWMNDVLDYISIDPFFRKGAHNKLTFGISYAFSENFVLPFSHDEIVHGKSSMVGKMPGTYENKFDALRTLLAYQMAYPGKKLSFMGNEIAQFIEWDFNRPLDWFLLEYEQHRRTQNFVRKLNHLYINEKALHEQDCTYNGFKWLVVDDNVQNIIVFYRESKDLERIIVVLNFSDVRRTDYKFGVPDAGEYSVILDSSEPEGLVSDKVKVYKTSKELSHGQHQCLTMDIEGNTAIFLKLNKNKK